MAYLIECDRCGNTERVDSSSEIPSRWLQFNQLWRGDGSGIDDPIPGGVFCRRCADNLEKWRQPIPQAKPMDYAEFQKVSSLGHSPGT